MNPTGIRTPILRAVDEWWFHVAKDGQKAIGFDVMMHRPRDIEEPGFKWRFDAVVREPEGDVEPGKGRRIVRGSRQWRHNLKGRTLSDDSLSGLRSKCASFVRALEDGEWRKVIVVSAGVENSSFGDSDHPIKFEWGVGFRSRCGRWFRPSMDKPEVYDEAYFLIGSRDDKIVVHDHTPELEASLLEMDGKFAEFGMAMSKLVQDPKRIAAASTKLLT